MVTIKDIITHTIESKNISIILSNAKKAEIGGCSQIRNDYHRMKHISEDQLVGQISTYCGSIILTGSQHGYIQARELANKNPFNGDGGVDIIGLNNIDIKGSLMRYSNNPLKYRLLIRPKERHKNWIYVLGLVPKERPYKCHLVGWINDSELPTTTYTGPIKSLKGAYAVDAVNLNRIQDLINSL
jgi:hypothetical protein